MEELYLQTREAWRRWLRDNHDSSEGVWLVFYKKGTGELSLGYDEAVEEALCFGWVDSLIRKLDEARFARKMTPRRDDSRWSASNIRRVEKLERQGLMAVPGRRKVEAARKAGRWQPAGPPQVPDEIPEELENALAGNRIARDFFDTLPPSQRKYFAGWIAMAKKPETRVRRAGEAVRLLERGERLGLK